MNVTKLKSRELIVGYTTKLGKDLPNLVKRTNSMKPVDELGDRDLKPPPPKPQPKPKPAPVRKTLIPRDCYLTASNPKIAETAKEFRCFTLADYPYSISVLFRVFLEQSVDRYLTSQGLCLKMDPRIEAETRTCERKSEKPSRPLLLMVQFARTWLESRRE